MREWIVAVLALGSPVLVGLAWGHYSDVIKEANAMGAQLTASALRGWELGSPSQRFSSELFVDVIWRRVIANNVAGLWGVALIAGAALFGRGAGIRRTVLICIGLFLLPLLLFTNLHIVHDYYQVSCAVFLTAALAVAVGAWLPRLLKHWLVTPVVTALLVGSNLAHFQGGYWENVRLRFPTLETRSLAIAEVLKRYTARDSAFVAFGYLWSSELAFYAERKSFTVPEFFAYYEAAWLTPEAYLGGTKLGAIVGCPSTRGPSPEEIMRRFESEGVWLLVNMHDCRILLRRDASPWRDRIN